MNNGLKVNVVILWDELQKIEKMSFRNVTEIHYGYDDNHKRIAFESDIHGAGSTYEKRQIIEFETSSEATVQDDFISDRQELPAPPRT